MAQTARTEAEKATDNVAELGKRTADKGADVAREAIDRTGDATRRAGPFRMRVSRSWKTPGLKWSKRKAWNWWMRKKSLDRGNRRAPGAAGRTRKLC